MAEPETPETERVDAYKLHDTANLYEFTYWMHSGRVIVLQWWLDRFVISQAAGGVKALLRGLDGMLGGQAARESSSTVKDVEVVQIGKDRSRTLVQLYDRHEVRPVRRYG